MKPKDFRKLDADLPRQPITDQRPWLIAGFMLAFVILVIAVCAYFVH